MFRFFSHCSCGLGDYRLHCILVSKSREDFFPPDPSCVRAFRIVISLSSPFSPSHRQPEIEPRTVRIRRIFNWEFANSIANRKCRSANRKFRTRGWCFAPKIISDSWSFFTSRFLTILFDCVVPHAESFFLDVFYHKTHVPNFLGLHSFLEYLSTITNIYVYLFSHCPIGHHD